MQRLKEFSQNKRRWFHWHRSSFLLMLLPLTVGMLLAVPAEPNIQINEPIGSGPVANHGWPAVHLQHSLGANRVNRVEMENHDSRLTANAEGSFINRTIVRHFCWAAPRRQNNEMLQSMTCRPAWAVLQNWNYPAANFGLRWPELWFNLLFWSFVCLTFGLLAETWRRRRVRFLNFSLADLILVTTVVSFVLGWCVTNYDAARDEPQSLGYVNELSSYGKQSPLPDWIERLVGRNCGCFDRIISASMNDPNESNIQALKQLTKLKSIELNSFNSIYEMDESGRIQLWFDLGKLAAIEHLAISRNHRIQDEGLEWIGQSRNLRTLEVHDLDVSHEKALLTLSQLKKLERLEIGFCTELSPVETARLRKLLPRTSISIF